MIKRRDVLRGGFAALAGLRPAHAQTSYPDRPIRLIIPFAPGGVYDAIGRPWADRMKSVLGTVVPENVGGAGGSVGAAHGGARDHPTATRCSSAAAART